MQVKLKSIFSDDESCGQAFQCFKHTISEEIMLGSRFHKAATDVFSEAIGKTIFDLLQGDLTVQASTSSKEDEVWIYVDIDGIDMGSRVSLRSVILEKIDIYVGYGTPEETAEAKKILDELKKITELAQQKLSDKTQRCSPK